MASASEIRQLENEVEELEKRVKLLRQRNLVLQTADKTRSHKGIEKAMEQVGEVDQIEVRYHQSQTELLYRLQKLTGMSVVRIEDNEHKVMFHPMLDNVFDTDKWSVTIITTDNGYELGRCFLPECFTLKDLDTSKPVNELLDHIYDRLNAYQNRKKQYCELEKHLKGKKVQLSTARGFLSVSFSMKLTVEDASYEVQVNLAYEPTEVLPHEILIDGHNAVRAREGGYRSKMSEEDAGMLHTQCQPFLTLPLKQAFYEAF